MPLQLLREMLHTPVLDILHHLKRSQGMTVGELGEVMKMSYMGVKQHCDELVRKGMLDTFRRAKRSGRPEKLYRITTRLDPLFTDHSLTLALDLLAAAQRVYGETAASKLLYTYFQAKTDRFVTKLAATDTLAAARTPCLRGVNARGPPRRRRLPSTAHFASSHASMALRSSAASSYPEGGIVSSSMTFVRSESRWSSQDSYVDSTVGAEPPGS